VTDQRGQSPPPRSQPRGPLLAIVGVALIGFCFFSEMPLTNLPMILIGSLLIVLFEFHSRIHGQIGLGKFHVSVISEPSPATEEMPPDPTELERRRREVEGARRREAEKTVEWDLPSRKRSRDRR
jgi:hypothetical protein